MSIVLISLIYLVSRKTHFNKYYSRVNADFYRVNKPVRQIFLNIKTEALGKNGVQNKIVLYPNSCNINACYNEVDLYVTYMNKQVFKSIHKAF